MSLAEYRNIVLFGEMVAKQDPLNKGVSLKLKYGPHRREFLLVDDVTQYLTSWHREAVVRAVVEEFRKDLYCYYVIGDL